MYYWTDTRDDVDIYLDSLKHQIIQDVRRYTILKYVKSMYLLACVHAIVSTIYLISGSGKSLTFPEKDSGVDGYHGICLNMLVIAEKVFNQDGKYFKFCLRLRFCLIQVPCFH